MNLGAIISAMPWLRRMWRVMPAPLRVPLLVVAAAVGLWYWVSGRKLVQEQAGDADDDRDSGDAGQPAT